ncbi:MAG TPA: ABC transporter ATP-binding protein [Candidatus Pullichristensenella excrementipullorum]|nr:ABC transporter ATP-binding protein [Candidatus Pullichristensenella excrementipullorum]
MSGHLLEAEGLVKRYTARVGWKKRPLLAVDGVSLHVDAGETLGLAGESGCGKSTLGRLLLHLEAPSAGEVFFDGQRVDKESVRALRRSMQMVFQDANAALDPRLTILESVAEGLDIHRLCKTRAERRERVAALLERVGLEPAWMERFPHELSGGQRQRVGIARALAVEPRFLVCDEPVSALDVSARAQVLELLMSLQRDLGLGCLFIAHDLAAVRQLSDRLAVMYLGRVVETGPAEEVLASPLHPYTRMLIASAPVPDPRARARALADVRGEAPSALDAPVGCPFAPRCPRKADVCAHSRPELRGAGGHLAACHRL